MELPGNLGTLDFSDWLYGLASAFISGGATAITGGAAVGVSDPDHFNIHTKDLWIVMGVMFVFSGVSNGANFLRTRPLPALKTTVTTVKSTELKQDPVSRVETTVQQTVVQPADAPPPPPPTLPQP
jgi:hypothetical protein